MVFLLIDSFMTVEKQNKQMAKFNTDGRLRHYDSKNCKWKIVQKKFIIVKQFRQHAYRGCFDCLYAAVMVDS